MLRTVAPLVALLDLLKHVPIDIQATPYNHPPAHTHTHTAARRAGPPDAAIPAGALFAELLQLCCSSVAALLQAEARAAMPAPGIARCSCSPLLTSAKELALLGQKYKY